MKGRFKVSINKDLAMKKQIQKFGNEPIVFYLHKHRNFLQKLENRKQKLGAFEEAQEIEKEMEE